MTLLKHFSVFITRLNDRLGVWLIGYLVLLMFVILLYEITARYVFSAPTTWATEFTQLMFGAYVMLSGGYLLANKGHVNVDLFYNRLTPRAQALTHILTSFLFFAFISVLLMEGWTMASNSIDMLETSSSAWNPPVWPLKLTIPIGAALILLQGVAGILEQLPVLFGAEPAADRSGEGRA